MSNHLHPRNPTKITAPPRALLGALLAAALSILGLSWSAQAAQAAVIPNAITSISTDSTVGGQGSQVDFTCQWAVPDGSQPGDTFTLQLPSQLRWFGQADFTLKNPAGQTVATAHASDSGLVIFTLSDFVASHPQNVQGTCNFSTLYTQVPPSGGSTQLDFQVGSTAIRVPVSVDDPCQQDCAPKPPVSPEKDMWWIDSAQTELSSTFHLPATTLASSDVTITDTPGPGTKIDCSRIVARVGTTLDQDGNIATPGDDETYPAAITCTPSLLAATWTGLPKGELIQLFVVTQVTDPTLDSYTNSGHVTIAGTDTPVIVEVRRTTASGTANGSALPSPTPTNTAPTSTASPTPTDKPSTGSMTPPPATSSATTSTAPAAVRPSETPSTPRPTDTLANTGAGGTAVLPIALILLGAGTLLALLATRKSVKRRVH
ncbi:Ig-like domain-containing protein [Arthrobacter sp. Y-9]|uniref:Ig-like domain-containing protein n=1 Tax=Arthrobacter sp. Y-9 TaxID=3039385 RepID=UPI00241E4FDA|nr:Ig-like domain-containing protein [Arthrobacter sp. Y-9]WFR84309.1 Ig-like domain-containing protein [Arthrobacter sp. Y-9]